MLKFVPFLILIPVLVFIVTAKALNNAYSPKKTKVETVQTENSPSPKPSFTLISTGDIGLVRDVNDRILTKKNPNYPFEKIADYLKSADLTVTNLEGPLIKNCPRSLTGFTFCGESTNVAGLVEAGIDAASLANNHTTNYGILGLEQTEKTLLDSGITPFGLENQITYEEIKGKKVALIGFVELGNNWQGLTNATEENVARLTREASQNAEIVITAFHWGEEYVRTPSSNIVNLAHIAVDNGSDLVLGNHPHWIQINEMYKDVFITYAQGNTIFDQDWSQETREGVLFKFEYQKGKFVKVEEKYTIIEDNSQPRFATEQESLQIKEKLSSLK